MWEIEALFKAIFTELMIALTCLDNSTCCDVYEVDRRLTAYITSVLYVLNLLVDAGYTFVDHYPVYITLNARLLVNLTAGKSSGYNVKIDKPSPILPLIEFLVDHCSLDIQSFGVAPHDRESFYDLEMPYIEAVRADRTARLQLIQCLTDGGSLEDISGQLQAGDASKLLAYRDNKRRGLLHHAALLGRIDVLDMLLSGYEIDLRSKDYRTALDLARAGGQSSFASRLHRHQAVLTVHKFCSQYLRPYVLRRHRRARIVVQTRSAITLQKYWRRYNVYMQYGAALHDKIGTYKRLRVKWARGKLTY